MAGHPPLSNLQPRRILVRSADRLGDAVMTSPALLRLRERFPEAQITLLTPEHLADLWRGHPTLDCLVKIRAGDSPFAVAQQLRTPAPAALAPSPEPTRRAKAGPVARVYGAFNSLWEVAAGVVSNRFDVAVVFSDATRAVLEVWLARVPQRIGRAHQWRNRFLTQRLAARVDRVQMASRSTADIRRLVAAEVHRPPDSDHGVLTSATTLAVGSHRVEGYLQLVATLGADPASLPPELMVTDEESQQAAEKFGLGDLVGSDFLLLGLNPGAEHSPAKRWPADRFIEAAALVQRHVKCRWLVFGSRAEAALAEKVAADIAYEAERPPTSGRLPPDRAAINLAGRTSLRELMALLRLCRVLLTNPTGPMHVAAALRTPVVAPFGSTVPELAGPGSSGDPRHQLLRSNAPCSPCGLRECPIDHRCMTGIIAEPVAQAVADLLRR